MRGKMPIFYSAIMLTAVNLLLRFVSTCFQVFISRRIGAAGVGLLQLVLSVGSVALTASMAGVRTASMYLTAEELGKNKPHNVTWILSGCFTYSIIFSAAISTLLAIFAPVIARKWIGNPDTAEAIRLFAAFIPVFCLCGVMGGYFTAANRIGTLAAVQIGEQLISMCVTVAALFLWAENDPAKACQSIILGSAAGSCVTLFILIILRLLEKAKSGHRIPVRRRLLHTALPLALADDLRAGISTTENLMVPKRLALYPGAKDPLAAFGTVCGMVFPVMMFPAAIVYALAELLIPELARCAAAGSKARIEYLVRKSLRVTMLYGFAFCGILFLLAEPLCLRLYDNSEAGMYLRWYALLVPMLYCDAITDAMTKGLGQQKACVRYNILTSAMDVVLLFLLLPHWGMQGYFISFLVTHLLNFGLSLRRLLYISQIRIPLSAILFCAASAAVASGICSLIPVATVRGIAFCAVYFCLLFLLGVVNKDDLLWIWQLCRKKN